MFSVSSPILYMPGCTCPVNPSCTFEATSNNFSSSRLVTQANIIKLYCQEDDKSQLPYQIIFYFNGQQKQLLLSRIQRRYSTLRVLTTKIYFPSVIYHSDRMSIEIKSYT